LLANAVDQSPSVLTDTPHSRASPFLHLDREKPEGKKAQRGAEAPL